jgi:ActR/RegA family two-component response regulator
MIADMKRLLISTDTVFLEYLRRLLEARGIGAFVRNPTNAGLAAGEVAPAVAQPELWVTPEDFAAAERILRATQEAFRARSGSSWTCPRCGERLEPQFEVCWRCGTERPE